MKEIFDKVAEQRIREAMENGEFDNLPAKGKRLIFEDAHIPEELRAAYKVLKNNGILPVEMDLKKEIVSLEKLIMDCECEDRKEVLRQKLTEKNLLYNVLMEKRRRR
jgi:hypothetical protein